jgi:superfamily II DNA or RNA helicase
MSEAHNIELDEIEYFGDKPMRWYQVAARNETVAALAAGEKRIMIVLPTGAGKTITIAATMGGREVLQALNIVDRKIRVLFVAHKHRLLSQAEETFAADNNVELIIQSMMSEIPEDVTEAGWDLCVLDECHHEGCASFQYHLEKLGDFPIIGLTATPDRLDGCVVKFDHIINPISREQAVAEGYLAKTSIHTFVDVPSKEKIDVLTDIFETYAHQMGQTMVFVKTKKEVTALTTVLTNLGYETIGILNQSDRELDTILNDFSAGDVQFIINCNKISEGVDVKGCTDVVLGRQLGSYAMLNQIVGRAARPDSDCNVWELINPVSGRNLDTTVVVGTPEAHRLINKERGNWVERQFDYVTHRTNKQMGMASGIRVRHH